MIYLAIVKCRNLLSICFYFFWGYLSVLKSGNSVFKSGNFVLKSRNSVLKLGNSLKQFLPLCLLHFLIIKILLLLIVFKNLQIISNIMIYIAIVKYRNLLSICFFWGYLLENIYLFLWNLIIFLNRIILGWLFLLIIYYNYSWRRKL